MHLIQYVYTTNLLNLELFSGTELQSVQNVNDSRGTAGTMRPQYRRNNKIMLTIKPMIKKR